ncbi:isoprenylcysteine carboxyl methyltransferase family protein [Prevotella amnii]|uniref:Isoprenylcysteine carboxyl methyltransferase family protein n=2 Tax=Prevotella amnii TaxID=419005 RepID=A0A134B9B4_9BACT|nr:isoprenylcysteine carboxyl methyltransferase family protein [Prevotella amnii]
MGQVNTPAEPCGISPPPASARLHSGLLNIIKHITVMLYAIIIFASFFVLRLFSLAFSIRNEKRLIKCGATQYGKRNSLLLTLAHIAYYFGALYEGYTSNMEFDRTSVIGVAVMAFAYIMLFYVIYKLSDVWTVKLYIVPNHRIDRSFLFRTVRHPNYFLNIIPELVGVALLCHAWTTLCVGLPLYGYLLIVRIRQEERAMRHLLS